MTDIDTQVAEFHRAFGYPVRSVPAVPGSDEIRLRLRLIHEEYRELIEAHACEGFLPLSIREAFRVIGEWNNRQKTEDVNLPAVADALADLDYVIAGTRLTYGIPGAEVAAEVQKSNLAKVGGKPDASGKLQKPEGWKPPDIEGVLRMAGWKP